MKKNGHDAGSELPGFAASPDGEFPAVGEPAAGRDEFAVGQALTMIGSDIGHLARRLEALEQAFAGVPQIHREAMERQTRFSALDLAIKAQPAGAVDGAATTALAEAFLLWLQAAPQGQALRLLLTVARLLETRLPELAPSWRDEDLAVLREALAPYPAGERSRGGRDGRAQGQPGAAAPA